jgi:hypothetical protein
MNFRSPNRAHSEISRMNDDDIAPDDPNKIDPMLMVCGVVSV